MKYIKKAFIILIVCIMTTTFLTPYSAYASSTLPSSDEYNAIVQQYVQELEKRFLIRIKYPIRADGYSSIGTASLKTLETSLDYLSESFVRQVADYYLKNHNQYLTFEFDYLPKNSADIDPAALGFFSSKTVDIKLYLPKGNDVTMSGCSPFTILHEFGHAYHFILNEKYSYDSLKGMWVDLNKDAVYTNTLKKKVDKQVFVSSYAAISYEEDFADTFSYIFTCNRNGLGLSNRFYFKDGSATPLYEKINYIESLIFHFSDNSSDALSKIVKMKKTSPVLYYGSVSLSGNSLEYIGLDPPHGVLNNTLNALKITPATTEWIYSVGAWKVSDYAGGVYLVFPGAVYVTSKIPTKIVSIE